VTKRDSTIADLRRSPIPDSRLQRKLTEITDVMIMVEEEMTADLLL
jgi:hypothetical protein